MIRIVEQKDFQSVAGVVKASGLFQPDELKEVLSSLTSHLSGPDDQDEFWVLDDDQGSARGAAYCAPEQLTDRTWNLLFIAVVPDHRGKGRGAELLTYVEQLLSGRGQRLLLVETSGVDTFENTRGFYEKMGYDEEARIRDYYTDGDDKIVFRKTLRPA